ncbi:MAG: ATP-binding protein [Pseudomonadota bacterium]
MKRLLPRLRDVTPHGLFARSLLILVLPVILLQIVIVTVYLDNHLRRTTERLSFAIAGEIAILTEQVEADPSVSDLATLQSLRHLNLLVTFAPGATVVPERVVTGMWEPIVAKTLANALDRQLRLPYRLTYDNTDDWVRVQVQVATGVLDIQVGERRLFSSSSYILLLWMVATSMVLMIISILFLRNQIRPIRKLAIAVERFGRGHDMPNFKPEGAREIRQAAIAFLKMHERIKRQVAQRTEMLAGISHDLRTPLTRLRLGLSVLPQSPDVKALEGDIQDMEKMINGYLDFVRGEGDEDTIALSLPQLLADVYQRAQRMNAAIIVMDPVPDVRLMVRPQALMRALINLVANGMKYASNMWLTADMVDEAHVRLILDDDGPGIDAALYEDAFRPFFRADPSRNTATGGVGLGLSITRDVITTHGGHITLAQSPQGGLRVEIILPI